MTQKMISAKEILFDGGFRIYDVFIMFLSGSMQGFVLVQRKGDGDSETWEKPSVYPADKIQMVRSVEMVNVDNKQAVALG